MFYILVRFEDKSVLCCFDYAAQIAIEFGRNVGSKLRYGSNPALRRLMFFCRRLASKCISFSRYLRTISPAASLLGPISLSAYASRSV